MRACCHLERQQGLAVAASSVQPAAAGEVVLRAAPPLPHADVLQVPAHLHRRVPHCDGIDCTEEGELELKGLHLHAACMWQAEVSRGSMRQWHSLMQGGLEKCWAQMAAWDMQLLKVQRRPGAVAKGWRGRQTCPGTKEPAGEGSVSWSLPRASPLMVRCTGSSGSAPSKLLVSTVTCARAHAHLWSAPAFARRCWAGDGQQPAVHQDNAESWILQLSPKTELGIRHLCQPASYKFAQRHVSIVSAIRVSHRVADV